MSAAFRKRWFPGVTNANVVAPQPTESVNSTPTHCAPLAPYLLLFGIEHVNFWSLDVEGAELEVLRGFDFDRVTVDVIAVEADGGNPEKDAAVVAYLRERGYERQRPACPDEHPLFNPHNDWFVRKASQAVLRSEPGKAAEWAPADERRSKKSCVAAAAVAE